MNDESFTWGDVVIFWNSVPQEVQIVLVVLGFLALIALISKI